MNLAPNETPNGLCAASNPDTARTQALCLQAYNGNTIAAMIRRDVQMSFGVKLEIEFSAATYCGAPNTLPETIKEGVRFITDQFGHLNLPEIREAFRLAAAGKIEAELSAFYGLFTIQLLGKVLAVYDDYRTAIFREVRAQRIVAQDAAENEQRAEMLKEKFGTIADQFAALQAKNDKYSRWQDLPIWFCDKVVKEDVGGFSLDEKGKAWVTAKHWAVNQLGVWRLGPNNSPTDSRRFNDAYAAIQADPECFPDELKPEAQEAYSKMLVYSKIAPYEKAI